MPAGRRNILARSADETIAAGERVAVDLDRNATRNVTAEQTNGKALTNSAGGTLIVRRDAAD
jgi:hypothetical protein